MPCAATSNTKTTSPALPLQRCEVCGLELHTITPPDAVVAVRSYPRRYRAALAGFDDPDVDADAVVRRRPPTGGWSALEYAAHYRDVLALYEYRIGRVLARDGVELESEDQDVWAIDRAYNEQPVEEVLAALATNAESMAATIAGVPDDGWDRGGMREGERITVLWMVQQTVHEGSHHLRDIQRILPEVLSRG